jgi:hypothetical protein
MALSLGLLALFLNPDEGGSVFFPNVTELLLHCTISHPRSFFPVIPVLWCVFLCTTFVHKVPRLVEYLGLGKCIIIFFTDMYYVLIFYRLSLGPVWTNVSNGYRLRFIEFQRTLHEYVIEAAMQIQVARRTENQTK